MSDKIVKIKPDKVRKRTVCKLKERKAYAEMIKYEKADREKLTLKFLNYRPVIFEIKDACGFALYSPVLFGAGNGIKVNRRIGGQPTRVFYFKYHRTVVKKTANSAISWTVIS